MVSCNNRLEKTQMLTLDGRVGCDKDLRDINGIHYLSLGGIGVDDVAQNKRSTSVVASVPTHA